MSAEAITTLARPTALQEGVNFLRTKETIRKVAIGTLMVGIGAAMMIDGAANHNNIEIFVGSFFLGSGLSTLLR